jgi:hypothetical protein
MSGSTLGVFGIIILGGLALAAGVVMCLTTKDPDGLKGAITIALIAGNAVSGLTGFIAGAHMGRIEGANGKTNGTDKVLEKPTVS